MKLTISNEQKYARSFMGIFRFFSFTWAFMRSWMRNSNFWSGKTLRVVEQIQGSLVKHKSLQMEYEIVCRDFGYIFPIWLLWFDMKGGIFLLFLFGAKLI